MPQGKSKTKVRLPANVKQKKKYSVKSKVICHPRKNAPVPPKSTGKTVESRKTMKAISKGLHENLETEIRAVAFEGKKSLLSKKELGERAAVESK